MTLRLLFLIGIGLFFGCVSDAKSFTEDDVLRVIDITCGDTWCEGDYNYNFLSTKFDIKNNTTTIFFQVLDEEKIFNRHCMIEGYSSPDDILNYNDLEMGFYTKLNICISGITLK